MDEEYPTSEEQLHMLSILEKDFPGVRPRKACFQETRIAHWYREKGIWTFFIEKGMKCEESMIEADYYSETFVPNTRYKVLVDDSGKMISKEETSLRD